MNLADVVLVAIFLATTTGLYQIIGILDKMREQITALRRDINSVEDKVTSLSHQASSLRQKAAKEQNMNIR